MRTNNKLILKNTFLLYARETVTLFISFFSSRLLLDRLGVDDFGMYGLIGSILLMFSSLRGLFASSIQRFISIEKGTDNLEDVNRVFCLGVIIHTGLSIFFVVVAEIVGLLCIPVLNMPMESLSASYWVLHFSIMAAAVTIMTVPYDALIIANEKFDIFAVFSIIEVVLKLVIVLLLIYSPMQRVITYSFLMLMVSILIRCLNAVYCNKMFEEARFHWVKDSLYMRRMTVFAGWQFLGNLGFSLMNSGMNMVINLFGGLSVNAARAIAYQVMNAVGKFTGSVSVSFQPQSMMLYARGEMDQYTKLMLMNTKIGFLVTFILGYLVVMMAPSLLKFWLGNVPEYTTEMVQGIFVYAIIRSLHAPIDTLFKAAGQLKYYQVCEFMFLSLNLPLSWWLLHCGYPYYSVFLLMSMIEFIDLLAILLLANRLLNFDSLRYCFLIFPRCLLLLGLGWVTFVYFSPILNDEYTVKAMIYKSLLVFVFVSLVSPLVFFNKNEFLRISQLISCLNKT